MKKTTRLIIPSTILAILTGSAFAGSIPMPPMPTVQSSNQINTNVNYMGGTSCFDEKEGRYVKNCVNSKIKELKTQAKKELSEFKSKIKSLKDEKKEQIKRINHSIRPTIQQEWKDINKNLRKSIKEIKEKYHTLIMNLKNEYVKATSPQQRQEIISKIKKIRAEMIGELKEKYGKLNYVQDLIKRYNEKLKLRQQTKANIEQLKQQANQIRTQFKEAKAELVAKFKTFILKKYQAKIDKMSLAKLEKIHEKIQLVKARIENMKYLSGEKKTQLMSVLAALDEVVVEKIQKLKSEEKSITDTESLLNNLLGN